MPFHYQAFGLSIDCNLPIADLLPANPAAHADLRIHLGEWPTWLTSLSDVPMKRLNDEPLPQTDFRNHYSMHAPDGTIWQLYVYPDGCEFLVNSDGTGIWSRWSEGYSIEDAIIYLLGPALGLAFYLRGKFSLHASAFLERDGAVLLLGPGGAGKSSTLAGFVGLGYSAITEDLAILEERAGRLYVQPGYPRIRLWLDGVKAVMGSQADAPRLTPTWDKRYLSIVHRFHSEAAPVKQVYVLGPRTRDGGIGKPKTLSPQEAFLGLLRNVYFPVPHDAPQVALHLKTLKQLADSGTVRSAAAAADPQRLPEFLQNILLDCGGTRTG